MSFNMADEEATRELILLSALEDAIERREHVFGKAKAGSQLTDEQTALEEHVVELRTALQVMIDAHFALSISQAIDADAALQSEWEATKKMEKLDRCIARGLYRNQMNQTELVASHARPKPSWPVTTPLRLDGWRYYLEKHGLLPEFQDVLDGIQHGFTLNSSIQTSETRIYPNQRSAFENPEAIDAMIRKEIAAGRFFGPHSVAEMEQLVGPFIAHPLSIVLKSNGQPRVVEDLSYPHNGSFPSVNSLSEISDLPVDWGGVMEMTEMLVTAKKGAQGATVDWGDAFRQIPVRRDELWMGVVCWQAGGDRTRAVDCYGDGGSKFGHRRSTTNFDRPNRALAIICLKEGFGRSIHWVDDLSFCREPINDSPPWRYSFDLNHILNLARDLGIPLPLEKIRDFAFVSRYVGFDWHWDTKFVEVPKEKREKVQEFILHHGDLPTISLCDLRSLCGRLSHLSYAVLLGRVNMRGLWDMLSAMLAKKLKDSQHWDWWPSAVQNLNWWYEQLAKESLGMKLCTERVPDDRFGVYVDASGWGIGIVIGSEFDAFKLVDDWKTKDGLVRDIGWAEFVAVELAVCFLISTFGIRNQHILIHSDNRGVVDAWKARSSRNERQNEVLGRILSLLISCSSFISIEYVPSEENPADLPSRGSTPRHLTRRYFEGFPTALVDLMNRAETLYQ